MKCTRCRKETAEVELPSHNAAFCRECFEIFFLNQLRKAIKAFRMFRKSEKILVAVSGGKDSMSLWHALVSEGYNVTAMFINLGIEGFSDLAEEKVRSFAGKLSSGLIVIKLKEEGIPIPEVTRIIRRPACAICGKLKRYYFNKVAADNGFDAVATGHNLDDETSRLLSNILHWKLEYLEDQAPYLPEENVFKRKVKPFFRLTEFEIAAYAFFHGIDYVTEACPFSKDATFSFYKKQLNMIEYNSPGTKIDFYQGFLKTLRPIIRGKKQEKALSFCKQCGYPTIGDLCIACLLKERISLGSVKDQTSF